MPLSPGTRLGPYEVVSSLGAGGMGEVYRATDSHLKRSVAIKVLPAVMAGDADRIARFQREAEVLAVLNHPNIAAIYGLEKTPSTGSGQAPLTALVMELVEGEDLSQRISRGAIPIDEALPIAKQIADALEAAHEQGIVHRDLKPANIKVRTDGIVKVLDFGLAKALGPEGTSASSDAMNSPTLTARATQMGMILGTAAYMSPEQAKGRAVDKRADIWAFGVVLYEMLSGRPAFDGEDVSDLLVAVISKDVDLGALPADTPPRLRALVRDCLIRDPRQRLRDIGDARIALDKIIAGAPDDAVAIASATAAIVPTWQRALPWAVALAGFGAAAVAIALWAPWRSMPAPPETRLEITTPPTDDPASFAISPDGRQLVFVATGTEGRSQLWLRPLDQTTPQALAGTEGASYPFWSPDSRSVAFFAGSALKRLDIGSGLPQTTFSGGAINTVRGGNWSAAGGILLGQVTGPLLRVSAPGAAPAVVTKLAPDQASHRWPHFLPGGRQFLFYVMGASPGLYLGSLDSPDSNRIAAADTGAQFVAPDWLLFVRQSTLLAQRVDLGRGEPIGEPMPVADQVAVDSGRTVGAFSVGPAGSITYRTGRGSVSQFTWFDHAGKVVGTIGTPDANGRLNPALSPDGRRVAAQRTMHGNIDLWLFDAGRETKLTFDAGRDMYPVWSPDGSRIAFSKDLKGALSLYQKSSRGGGAEELLLASSGNVLAPQAWSPDGRFLLYTERSPVTALDLWVLPLDGKQPPSVFLNSKFEERSPQFSPDGRWVAYMSDETGRPEIYLRPFPASSGQFPVSTTGGIAPRWRKDGKELYYIAPDSKLMAVSMATTGRAPEMGAPVALFRPYILYGGTIAPGVHWQYDVAPDGRFLINVTPGDVVTPPITVIQHWQAGIKK